MPHLGPHLYDALNHFVHRGHEPVYRRLVDLMEITSPARVLEIGCGTGLIAQHFVAGGYDYFGLDIEDERVDVARARTPGGTFVTGDATQLSSLDIPEIDGIFIHGVLHHLNDEGCQRLLSGAMQAGPHVPIAIIEPVMPDPGWKNPPGTLMAKLDDGDFVRSRADLEALLTPFVESSYQYSLWPRWPVPFVGMRLRQATAVSDSGRA